MKKKSTSRSAFFNLRVLAALLVGMTGVSLALFAANPLMRSTSPAKAQQKYNPLAGPGDISILPPGFDCSKIHQFHIDVQENLRAYMILVACGEAPQPESGPPSPAARFSKFVQTLLPSPRAYGGTDVDLVTGPETFPNVTQSETYTTANPDNPLEVFVAYNDSRGRNFTPINISGGSFSSDGGVTFTRLTKADGQGPFDNTFGDPVILYHKPSGTWLTAWLDGGCGGQGLGGYKSTTPGDPNSWTHYCVHTGSFDDRESGWVDNNPSSPFFGRLYVSWNDYTTSCGVGGCLFQTHSSDGGVTWSTPVEVQTNTGVFNRDVQITGDMSGNGTVYIAAMDEGGGGFPHNDTNYIYKSTDGGVTWTNTYVGTPFPGPGVTSVGYFAQIFNANGGYWRHEGWGEPAAFNNIVSLVYDQHGTGSDPADVYYIRSTDGGVTFSTPLKLNTDTTDRPNWQPNLSVSPSGTLFATWYDARVSSDSDCVYGSPTSPCYQMFSRKSNDNGVTWLPDDTLSDVVSPLPAQPDPGIQPTYAGDYDYGTAVASKHMTSWCDGRVAINSTSQQDAFTDRELVGFSVTTTDPACGSLVTGTAPTSFVINLSDAVNEGTVDPGDFTVNGTPANSDAFSNGDLTITFTFNTSPVVEGPNTMNIPANSFTRQSDNQGNLAFNCTFQYSLTPPTPTPTPTPPPCSWSAGPALPTVLIRAVGVAFPDSNFYSVGGRTSDLAGSDFQHVLKFDTTSNTWTQMPSTLADNQGNNMACGVLTVSGTPLIYCVGGNAAGATTATARVYSYDPATDTQTVLTAADDWPGDTAGTILPGGFAVANNKLYILGGFNINVASTNQIWSFDPTAAVGSKWTMAPANTPEGVMYAPTCTIGGIIYLAGASDYQGGTVVDTTNSFSFDPGTNTIGTIAPIPRATGETRGLNFNGQMYVMGGGRVAPNPSSEVDIYDPGTNSWSIGIPFVNARRNFPADTNGTDHIWLAGGYEPSTPAADMEIFFCRPQATPTPTPTVTPSPPPPTPTPTPSGTPSPSPTPTPRATPRPRPTPFPRPTPP